MNPEFPLIQIDIEKWNEDLLGEIFRFDPYYYSNDHEFYEKYLYEKRFLDSNGQIFIAKEKILIKEFWSRLGLRKKYKITFEKKNEKWSFDEIKNHLLLKVSELSFQEGKKEWINAFERAKTIKELIGAPR